MNKKNEFFAIKRGRKNGIFKNFEEFSKHVNGFEGALYKKFNSYKKALEYLGIQNDSCQEIAKLEIAQTEYFSSKNGVINAYVDGSFKENVYSGAFIVVENNLLVYERSKKGVNKKAAKVMGSNAGELNATMLAIQYAINKGAKKILIYHDNLRIRHLITEKKEPKNDFEKEYVNFVCQCKEEKGLKIDFIKVKAHNGGKNKWNEYVDELASETRTNNYEVKRDLKQIKDVIHTIISNIKKFDSPQKKRFNEIQNKIYRLECITNLEEIFLKKLFEDSKKGDYVEKSFECTYELYKKGLKFEEIVECRGLTERTVAYHLMICKMKNYPIELDEYIPKVEKSRKICDKTIIDCISKGFSVKEMIQELKQTERTVLNKIVVSYKNREIVSIDRIFSKEKQHVIENKEIKDTELANKCFNYFKENKGYMSKMETNKAYMVYKKVKENSVIEKEQIEIVTIAKLVKRRNDIFNSSESSYVKSYLLMETGLSINDVAEMRNLQATTIMIHLIQNYREGKKINLTNYLTNQSHYEMVLDKLKNIRTNDIRVLKANLPDYVSYEDIKIVMAVSGVSLSA